MGKPLAVLDGGGILSVLVNIVISAKYFSYVHSCFGRRTSNIDCLQLQSRRGEDRTRYLLFVVTLMPRDNDHGSSSITPTSWNPELRQRSSHGRWCVAMIN